MVLLQQLRKCSKSKCSHHNFLTRVCLLKRALFPEAALTATLNESHLENCMKMARAQIRPAAAFLLDLEIRLQLRPAMLLHSTIQSSKYNGGFFGGSFCALISGKWWPLPRLRTQPAQNPFEYPFLFYLWRIKVTFRPKTSVSKEYKDLSS